MTQPKYRYRFLLVAVLLLIMVIPKNTARADTGIPPAHPGSSLSPGNLSTNLKMVSEEVVITFDDDPYQASISTTITAANPTEIAAAAEPSSSNNSLPFSLIMGVIFIGAAGVLIIIAVKRGEK